MAPESEAPVKFFTNGVDWMLALTRGDSIVVDGLFISLLGWEDNRCPKDVRCFWEGYISATLDISGEKVVLLSHKEREYNVCPHLVTLRGLEDDKVILRVQRLHE